MSGPSKMTGGRLQPALGLKSKDCLDGIQNAEETGDVLGCPGVDYIDVKGDHGSALQDCGDSTDEDEFDTVAVQNAQYVF